MPLGIEALNRARRAEPYEPSPPRRPRQRLLKKGLRIGARRCGLSALQRLHFSERFSQRAISIGPRSLRQRVGKRFRGGFRHGALSAPVATLFDRSWHCPGPSSRL